MLFTRVFIVSALTYLTMADPVPAAAAATTDIAALPTDISDKQASKAASKLQKYLSTKTTDPAYIAAEAAFTSAMPSSVYDSLTADPSDFLQGILTETAPPDWYSAVPTSAQNVLSSVGMDEISIATKAASGPAPTNVAKIGGAALAAGAAVLAVL